MNIKVKKLRALCRKDFSDYLKNPSMLISTMIPVLFILLYRNLNFADLSGGDKTSFLLKLGAIFNCTMCATMMTSTSIAEEKEKFTLRTLILSNVSASEFLISKLLLAYIVTMIGNILIFLIAGAQAATFPLYFITTTLGCLSMMMLSSVIGIVARDQMTCSVYQIPMMLLFMLPPMFSQVSETLAAIARFTPLNAMIAFYYNGTSGKMFTSGNAFHFAVMGGWILFSVLLFIWFYRKKGIDN